MPLVKGVQEVGTQEESGIKEGDGLIPGTIQGTQSGPQPTGDVIERLPVLLCSSLRNTVLEALLLFPVQKQ